MHRGIFYQDFIPDREFGHRPASHIIALQEHDTLSPEDTRYRSLLAFVGAQEGFSDVLLLLLFPILMTEIGQVQIVLFRVHWPLPNRNRFSKLHMFSLQSALNTR
ncbi:MAG: hypothetical protein WKF37_01075 [Bryobacteraceae bacterium]